MLNANSILSELKVMFPNAACELKYRNPFELLVSVVLSAQTTDIAVNKVTPALFQVYKTPKDLGNATLMDVERHIKQIGLYKTKAKNIVTLSKILLKDYDGVVPCSLEELIKLPGVGRKTANVVLAEAFHIPAIAVDTHVSRVSQRLGLTFSNDPVTIEQDLMSVFAKEEWISAHQLLLFFGRYFCKSQKPKCSSCPFVQFCTYEHKNLTP